MKKMKNKTAAPALTPAEAKKRRIKRILTAAAILVVVTVLCYWSMPKNVSMEASDAFDEQEVKAAAEKVVEYISAEDYESLQEMTVEKMRAHLTEEKFSEAQEESGGDWGEFRSIKEYKSQAVTQRGTDAAVVSLTAEYENKDVVYMMAFNTDMKLASFGIQ